MENILTKKVEELLKKTPLYSTDGVELKDKKVICKFFTPFSNWAWYVFEGNKLPNGDWEFFGMVNGFEKEMGYFYLSELKSVGAICDENIFNKPYKEIYI